uniref:Sodium-coupled neutral amino acid symporter 2 n=1 Tax=Denticeps clupeoides TaxID=299321 RepID=A0AAY4D9D4_9TELE
MRHINPQPDGESYASSNSNDYAFQDKKFVSSFPDDAESQNFLPNQTLGKKKYEAEYNPGNASFGMSVFNLSNAIMGSGILGLSYAMANTGIALFVILLVAVSIFSLYSVHLLLKTANEGGSLVYENLGYKAFGHPGKLAASLSITMQNIGAMSSYLYIVKYELPTVIEVVPVMFLKRMVISYLGYTSGFSLLCMVFFLIVVSSQSCFCHEASTQVFCLQLSGRDTRLLPSPSHVVERTRLNNHFLLQTVYAIPILTFAFVCHPAILPMYEELKDRSRKKMQGVANVSFLGMFIMYLLAALFGYLTFYARVEPELLHTFSKVYQFDVVLLIVRLAVLTAVTLTVPVVLFPIRTSVNAVLWPNKEFNWIRHVMITVVLLVAVNILVIFVPTIRDIFGFIGASAAAMLIFILPSAFYIKLVIKEPMLSVQKIGATLFLISGFLVMIVCMSLIILDWVHQAMSPPSPGSGH